MWLGSEPTRVVTSNTGSPLTPNCELRPSNTASAPLTANVVVGNALLVADASDSGAEVLWCT